MSDVILSRTISSLYRVHVTAANPTAAHPNIIRNKTSKPTQIKQTKLVKSVTRFIRAIKQAASPKFSSFHSKGYWALKIAC